MDSFPDVTDKLSAVFRPSPSATVLVTAWFWFCLVMSLAYFCNLRAFLVTVDYERAIDSGADILELDRKLYLPLGKHSSFGEKKHCVP